ncbi:MAG: UBP-type zinc finger domain-containing protein [Acidimicrobiales bacterium]
MRRCTECGHVGCYHSSPGRHATGHWRDHPDHPVICSYEPGRTGGGATTTTCSSSWRGVRPHRPTPSLDHSSGSVERTSTRRTRASTR